MYEEIPEEQIAVIDNMYKSLHTHEESVTIKCNGDDEKALKWISDVLIYIKNPSSENKPDIIFA
jgi:hypothetical protein